MKKRIHLKRKFKPKKIKKNLFIISLILIIVCIILLFRIINNKMIPIYVDYATMEAKKIGSVIINRSVNSEVEKKLKYDDLLIVDKNSKNEVMMIDFNPVVVNRILNDITNNIQNDFKEIKRGNIDESKWEDKININSKKKGVIYEMPSGIVFNNVLFRNLGPKIPVKLELEGDILTNINTHVSNYGINNALIEISVVVEVNEKVILPITTKDIKVKSSIPLFIKMIQGTVPEYLGGIEKNSSYYK